MHNSVRIDGLPQLTGACVVNIVTVTYHHFNITAFLAYLSCSLLVPSTIGLTVEWNRMNRFELIDSNRFSGVNRIEIIFGESECTSREWANGRHLNGLPYRIRVSSVAHHWPAHLAVLRRSAYITIHEWLIYISVNRSKRIYGMCRHVSRSNPRRIMAEIGSVFTFTVVSQVCGCDSASSI